MPLKLYFPTLLLLFYSTLIFSQNEKFQNNPAVSDSIYSEILKEQRLFYVQFPDNYNTNSEVKYPVAFILDGEFLMPTVHNFQGYYSGGFTPEMILIGISNLNNRTRDLTTSKITESYGMPYTRQNGEAENFVNFMANELIPYIEKNYSVSSFRTLIGHSYGGLFTVYTLIHHPELFANYVAIDPSLDWDKQKLIKEAKDVLSSKNYQGKSLFMSLNGQLHWQNKEITIDNVMEDDSDDTLFPRSNLSFKNTVEKYQDNGLALEWKFYPNDLHGTIQFPSVRDGLIALFKWFQMENTDKINSFETSTEELNSIIRYRADKLEQHLGYVVPPYPEDLLNMSGYMSMDMQNMERAKLYFESAIEFYPKSANAYDSMSDFYEQNKDIKNALKYAQMAYKIESSDYLKQKIKKLSTD
ncbi:alpha/beta hydrolase-fold protein [Winogradskyella alexanderae]|uniref:Prolyl oligopeptidase family serine peptidase n=1 Tax=Winogradskyella alexanderae TaxID=2877123 RepID=A0ABS7XS69_9FLAO|nr:alpha/beta hydrolase-fold protein [Winogradskyella alexanderae]MCA0132874.1 prolyl oligopeptidase family serine peptidase [Winogradskyella alexanderae]